MCNAALCAQHIYLVKRVEVFWTAEYFLGPVESFVMINLIKLN